MCDVFSIELNEKHVGFKNRDLSTSVEMTQKAISKPIFLDYGFASARNDTEEQYQKRDLSTALGMTTPRSTQGVENEVSSRRVQNFGVSV